MLGRLTPFSSEYSGKTLFTQRRRELAFGDRPVGGSVGDYGKGMRPEPVIFELSQREPALSRAIPR